MEPKHGDAGSLARKGLALGALGVVFGDIGTSPLYTIRECLAALPPAEHGLAVLGVLSLVFWSLIFVVSFKYATFVLRADNKGEGGIFALLALSHLDRKNRTTIGIGTIVVLIGAAMLSGEAIITPAITVLSAVEGLKFIWPDIERFVVPAAIAILAGIFAFQHHGTKFIGNLFGPVMLVWFIVLGGLGFWQVLQHPGVLVALNPMHGFSLLVSHPKEVTVLLGSVVLAITGVEALYADLGHFGRRAILSAWYGIVLPGLTLNYFGQGAYVLSTPDHVENTFLALAPAGIPRFALLLLSVMAAIIASQALISGAYSLIRQAIQLGYFPRLTVRHTNPDQRGQIYLPLVNISLGLGAIATVYGFKSSSALAAAYGIAVTGTMIVTTLTLLVVMRVAWRWSAWKAVPLCVAFLIVDVTFFYSNLHKFADGGWLPIGIALFMVAIMHTWKTGKNEIQEKVYVRALVDLDLTQISQSKSIIRVPGCAVFMAGTPKGIPLALLHHLKATKCLQETAVLLTIVNREVPHVPEDQRLIIEEHGGGVWRVICHYGYMESPDLTAIIQRVKNEGVPLKIPATTFYFNREMIITGGNARMFQWQKNLYSFLSRNARPVKDYYNIMPTQVIEIGLPVQL